MPGRVPAFVLGGVLPDLPVYVLFFVEAILLGTSQAIIWNERYFASAWTPWIEASHSFVLWGGVALFGYVLGRKLLAYFGLAGVLHAVIDFCVHVEDAYPHFWPLSDWRFESPVSYWDPAHFGNVVGTVDIMIVLGLLYFLYKASTRRSSRSVVIVLALFYIVISTTSLVRVIFAL